MLIYDAVIGGEIMASVIEGKMKKLIDKSDEVVDDMTDGIVGAYPDKLRRMEEYTNIVRKDAPVEEKVALVSGGGSGHEPAHYGYVGEGMLDAACAGETFTSPTVPQITEAVKEVGTEKGVLLIVKNFEGDVMNFKSAGQTASMEEDIEVEHVVVNDDVAQEDPEERRGIAGTVFVHKCAGAKAEKGADLDEVKAVAEKVIDRVNSMGCAITSCVVPEKGEATFDLGPDEMEVGIGIHGEPGIRREELKSADEIVKILADNVIETLELEEGDEIAALIQGNGGTPNMEKFVLYKDLYEYLEEERGLDIWRAYVGEYMTSLDMMGTAVSLLELDEEIKELLDGPVDTFGFAKEFQAG